MTTVDITLGTIPNKSNNLDNLTILKQTQLYCFGLGQLSDFINVSSSDKIIDIATDEVSKRMNSDIDTLIREARIELIKAKALVKKKYPIRNRFEIIKLFFKNPKLFIYAYNRRNGN
nr:hypothetical protein [uncultured Flavobacterium sp.]